MNSPFDRIHLFDEAFKSNQEKGLLYIIYMYYLLSLTAFSDMTSEGGLFTNRFSFYKG